MAFVTDFRSPGYRRYMAARFPLLVDPVLRWRVTMIPEGLEPLDSDYSWVRDSDDYLVRTLRPLWFVGR